MSHVYDDTKPLASIEALVMRHGAVTIGLAFLRAAFAKRPVTVNRDIWVSDHMRRDIGLAPRVRADFDGYRHRLG